MKLYGNCSGIALVYLSARVAGRRGRGDMKAGKAKHYQEEYLSKIQDKNGLQALAGSIFMLAENVLQIFPAGNLLADERTAGEKGADQVRRGDFTGSGRKSRYANRYGRVEASATGTCCFFTCQE